ncbi:MAG: peptidoglycan editing factor PgeF [Oscillospiraceae bacterium]|jgi:YfiH family protein|nr:peptidoglycan editing factor PgeF [Oscillospiraceae bacterium]
MRRAFGTRRDTPESLGFSGAYGVRQIKTDNVVIADGAAHDADAVITNRPGLPVFVKAADCVPILLYDPAANCVAAVHSGWQGTALNIAAKTVRALSAEYGSKPANLRAFIGPAICGECYEVGGEVSAAVSATLQDKGAAAVPGKPLNIDLKAAVAQQLTEAGVTEISVHPDCTKCNPDKYWSHRHCAANGIERGGGNNISIIEL